MYGDDSLIPLLFLLIVMKWRYTWPFLLVIGLGPTIPALLQFKKAGYAWWQGLIPFYNLYLFTKLDNVSWLYFAGLLFPYLAVAATIFGIYYLLG